MVVCNRKRKKGLKVTDVANFDGAWRLTELAANGL